MEYEYGIRNTDLVSKLEYIILSTDYRTLPKACRQNTEYEYGVRNMHLVSMLKYTIRIRKTEYALGFKAEIRNQGMRIRNTDTEYGIRSVFQS